MDPYYDKNKFSGAQPHTPPYGQRPSAPQPPPPAPQGPSGGPNQDWWCSWPVIIILFAIGLWPLALAALFMNLFSNGNEKKRSSVRRSPSAEKGRESFQGESAAEQAIRRARERAEAQWAQRRTEPAKAAPSQAGGQGPSAQRPPQPQSAGAAGKLQGPRPFKTPLASILLRFFGAFFLIGGCAAGMTVITELAKGYGGVEDAIQALAFLAAGGGMFLRGHQLARTTRRSQRYILAIGNADAMPVAEIAKRVNRTPEKAAKEMQRLIDKGYLGEDAYIDRERGYFLRFGATLEEEQNTAAPPPAEAEAGYSGILRKIRRANDRIADEALSRKIDRLEQVSGLIFREVEEHPEKRENIHTFFDYYLPTTQKLLDAYAEFEATGVDGENLRQAKERIEQTMDAIVDGFEHQLDQLYSSDAMDVVSDIKVMEAMLNRDTASAARDFGYANPSKPPAKAGGQDSDGTDEGGGTQLQI